MATTRRSTKAELKRARVEAARQAMARAQRRSRNLRVGLWSAGVVVVLAAVGIVIALTRPHAQPSSASALATTGTAAPAASAVGRAGNPPWGAPADASAA